MIANTIKKVLRRLPGSATTYGRPLTVLRTPNKALRTLNFCFSEVHKQNTEKMEFKTETKRLLDIVAKSLYTDQQVFLRQLLSNASDALEKQRLTSDDGNLNIKIIANENKKELTIEDNGIGMSKQDLMNNLGTIARSGSKEFVEELTQKGGNTSNAENIIGQFGVGFYSSFIVADYVDVISVGKDGKTHCWSSDGSGTYEISQVADSDLKRGTRIVLHMKPSASKFVQTSELKNIIQKYSNFINYPISMNDQSIQMEKALWSRDKRELTDEDYKKFAVKIGAGAYYTKLHYSAEVPLSIKTVLYIPEFHMEKYGMGQEKGEVSLYSKKVLIKKDCRELLPNYLRFVKGVVDCEDIPLNISRETYQDSSLISKIRTILTNRILRHLKEEAEKNPMDYNKWYRQFQVFIKEGSMEQGAKQIIQLNRFKNNLNDKWISLKDYVQMAKQSKTDAILYYIGSSSESPYLQPFNKAKVPVLLSQVHLDEVIFKNITPYESMKFVNIQTSEEDVNKYLGETVKKQNQETIKDATTFALWVKNELQPLVSRVDITKKNISGPGLVLSAESSSVRQLKMIQSMMAQQQRGTTMPAIQLSNLTFQINPHHDLMIGISELRKTDSDTAGLLMKQVFDNCCVQANLQTDKKDFVPRVNKLIKKIIEGAKKEVEVKEPTRK